jgi:hypothetical protein
MHRTECSGAPLIGGTRYPVVPIAFARQPQDAQMTERTSAALSWKMVGVFVSIFVMGGLAYALYPLVLARIGYPLPSGGPPRWFDDLFRALLLNASMAGGVGALFEVFASRELISSASKEIASRVLGHHLPEGFDERIREIVHGTNFVLEDWTANYIVTEEDSEHVKVTIDQLWRVQNYSSRPETYQTKNAEEAVYQPRILLLEVIHKGKPVAHYLPPTTRPDTGAFEALGPTLKLAPRGKDGDSCFVHWQMQIVAPKRYSHILAFGAPTLNPRIRVLESHGFEFFAAKSDTAEATATTWHYHRAYLPGQHLRVWWKPKNVTEPA